MVENLLTLNDMINNSMAKFADIQKGIYDTQYEISGKPPKQTDETEEPRQAISLIDLDDEPSTGQQAPASTASKGNVLDELSDIFGQSASISPPQQQQQPAQQQSLDPLAFLSSNPPATSSSPSPFGLQALPPPPAVSPTLSSSSLGTPSASGSIREQPSNTSQENVADNASSTPIKHEPGQYKEHIRNEGLFVFIVFFLSS